MKNNPSYPTVLRLVLVGGILGSFPCHAAFAQVDAKGGQETGKQANEVSSAQRRFTQAIERLDALEWIQADIRQTMNVGGRKFLATGRHLQGPNLKLRRELNVSVGKTKSSMLEVCDGETFFLKHQIDETIELKQVLVKEVLDKIEEEGLTDEQKSRWLRELGLTGLAEYLRGINQTHQFHGAEEGEWEGHQVVILHARWKPEVVEDLAVAAPIDDEQVEGEAEKEQATLLPENIPDEVVCYLGVENGIPYRVEFLKIAPGKQHKLGVIELTDVVVGQPIEDREFDYIAPSEAQDLTDQFILRIEVESAEAALDDDTNTAEE